MKILDDIKGLLVNQSFFSTADWWVEITTTDPRCTYYFGPFPRRKEAESLSPEYIEDLESEGAREIRTEIKRCQPENLTVYEEN
jgi:Domain of unknown function (DUF1816)